MIPLLRMLIVEDSPTDAELLVGEVRKAGYEPVHCRVETAEQMRTAISNVTWDVVLSDFTMRSFTVAAALRVLQESGRDIPFFVISDDVGDEAVAEALKRGAHDFMARRGLARLLPAIEREVREVNARRAHRQGQEELRASERRLRAVMETATDAIVSFEDPGVVVYVNPATERMFDAADDHFVGRPFTDLISRRSHAAELEVLSRFLATRDARNVVHALELLGRRPDDSVFPVELSCARWTSEQDAFVTAIIRDVSDRKQIEAQLLIHDRMASVGTLTAGVAHEINNPLCSLLANLELAAFEVAELGRRHGASNELRDLRDEVENAREAGDRVRQIVRDLKAFSRADAETREPVNVQQILDSTARIAWSEIHHRARFVKDYHDVPQVDANESRLGQVFLNLIVNAAQSIPEGRSEANEIRVTTRRVADGRVEVEVRDTGTGMAQEIRERLFTPFFSTKRRGVGTGLGLSICKRIVDSWGGEISVESELGKGSTFRVRLRSAEVAAVESERGTPVPSIAPRRGRVLVIDDETTVLGVIRRAISAEHDVTTSESANEALDRIRKGEIFDVILCDLMMPQVTGMDLYAELARSSWNHANNMIFLTGGVFTPRARTFLDQIPNLCVEKPFTLAELRTIVNSRIG